MSDFEIVPVGTIEGLKRIKEIHDFEDAYLQKVSYPIARDEIAAIISDILKKLEGVEPQNENKVDVAGLLKQDVKLGFPFNTKG